MRCTSVTATLSRRRRGRRPCPLRAYPAAGQQQAPGMMAMVAVAPTEGATPPLLAVLPLRLGGFCSTGR